MTRIIAGFAGSLTLTVPPRGTRPTSDRVREAVFSALDARGVLPDADVLDLYAGSGALGLEAASRGAATVSLVERGRAAAAVCRANAERVRRAALHGADPKIAVHEQSVQSFLDASTSRWNVAFIDPPYDIRDDELAAALQSLAPQLAPDAVAVLERATRSAAPKLPAGLELDRQKSYGDTTLWWLRAPATRD